MVSSCACAPGVDGQSSGRVAPRGGLGWASETATTGEPGDSGRVKARAGFDPSCRLRRPDEFAGVLKSGGALRSQHFVLKHRSNACGGARLGLIVGRKLLKRAVDRNLVKRIAREAFRTVRWRLTSLDVVLRLAMSPESMDRSELRNELDRLLARLVR